MPSFEIVPEAETLLAKRDWIQKTAMQTIQNPDNPTTGKNVKLENM